MNTAEGTLNDFVLRAKESNIIPRGELRQMMDSLPVGLYWNLPGGQGTFLYVNRTLVEMFGYGSREEFLAIEAVDLYPDPAERDRFSQRLLQDGKLQGIELQLKKKDGTRIWCRESCHAVLDDRGDVVCFHGVIEDISDLKRREDRLRRVNRLATQLSGTMGIDSLLHTLVGQARRLVEADLAIVARVDGDGQRISDIIASNLPEDRLPPDADVPGTGAIHQVARGNELFTDDLRMKYDSGILASWCPELRACIGMPVVYQDRLLALLFVGRTDSGQPFSADDLDLIRTMASLAAISIHSADQFASLTRADALNRKILETATTAVFTVGTDKRITSVNEACCQITGHRAEDLLGQSCSMLGTDQCDDHCALFDSDTAEPKLHRECRVVTRAGRVLTIVKNAALLHDENGRPIGGVESFIDISELIEKRQSAEAASTAKSNFLANMSHEIRTPLNGVMGMLELALTTELTGEQQEYMNTAKTCADTLLSLINDVLDLSKIEAGKLHLELITFSLRDMVDGLLDVMSHPAAAKSLELIGHVDRAVPDQVKGDPTRLRQILINLVGNGIKFTNEGEVLLKIDTVAPERESDFPLIRFTVADTGIGIPDDKLANIFKAFTQADESTTRNFGGTGLGLTITRELVEVMGGRLDLETAVGKGSTFSFTLPLPAHQAPSDTNAVTPPDLQDTRVLVVDDNSNNRLILRQELGRLGCRVDESSSSRQAVEAIAGTAGETPYDLVILDLKLSGIDGFDVAREIRSSDLPKQPRLLLMTSLGVRGDAARCREIGIDGYFVKPIKRTLLLEAINRVMSPQSGPADTGETHELVTRYTVEEESETPSNTILLAEDHPVNTKLAVRLLKDAGYAVVTAENGREALERLAEHENIDLVLMDIQMPEMDGLEATARIRAQERYADLPIIAMTAHAMAGDRSRCLQQGMNDYISKPVRHDLLIGVVSRWLGHGSGKRTDYHAATTSGSLSQKPKQQEPEPGDDKPPINLKKALGLVSGDRGFLVELLREYLDDIPNRLATMEQAIADGDADQVRRAAHSIKGASTSLGTETIGALALHLEARAASGNLEDAADLHRQMSEAFTILQTHLGTEFPELGSD